jgi:hypothetical protein
MLNEVFFLNARHVAIIDFNRLFELLFNSGPVINCKALGKIEGGFATRNQSFHGGKVVFKCNANYVMVGKPAVLCKSGKWLRNPPKCYGT